MEFELNPGNTAWLLTASSLVLLMTPGLAFFYGGMVRGKSVLNMMMMSFSAIGVVGIIWAVYGYGLAFGADTAGGFIGNPADALFLKLDDGEWWGAADTGVPALVFAGFQATFAIITVALISGAIADRVKFVTWLTFAVLWVTLVYTPVAHWVWGGGILAAGPIVDALSLPIDFAGGTVVHINAGAAGLALALVIGKRKGFGTEPMRPHNLPFVMLGAGLLWFGWFGFNAGSELAADGTAGRAWVNTLLATCVAMLAWMATEKLRDGSPTSLGAASGVVAGLVAITPAAGTVQTEGALVIGLVAGVLCALAVGLKFKFGFDDSLDVVGVHLVGGLVGTVLIGFFATNGEYGSFYFEGSLNGLFYGGGAIQLVTQVVAALIAVVYSFVLTYGIGLLLKVTLGWRVTEQEEVDGIDLAEHGETAYEANSTIAEVR
ncbi:ammonium transporter [Myceligenerans crystallogenes]|uniref:Ammonium transporter n=1 Tax=Myceligenerans crystallogenes TaxID=316335 RepID=A0ABN2NLF7_9MICO